MDKRIEHNTPSLKRIVFFGDSVSNGEDQAEHNTFVARLSQLYCDHAVITTSAINGETTRQALLRMPYHIGLKEIDILFVEYGLNDANVWDTEGGLNRVSLESYTANLREIHRKAINFGIERTIYMTSHPVTKESVSRDIATYNEAMRLVAWDFGILLIDMEKYIHDSYGTDFTQHLMEDGVHLSTIGHDIYTKQIAKSIQMLGILL